MARTPEPQRGTYLPTGWRVVGPNAEQIVERAAAAAVEELRAGEPANTLLALQCTAEPFVRGRPTVERVLEAVTEEIRQVDEDCPRLIRDEEVARPPSRLGGLRYDVMTEPGKEWLGDLVWRRVHPVVAGAPITTRLLIEERPSFTRFSMRVTADEGLSSVRGYVGAGQIQPRFLRTIGTEVPVTWMGAPVEAHTIAPTGMADFVHSILGGTGRDVPVALLSPLEDGSFVLDPDDLAWELLGRARLYVIRNHKQTFELSDLVGDSRMSCYWGAVRCYLPGWTRHDNPYEHPLLVGERAADPVLRATWIGEVGLWMGRRIELPPSIQERRAPVAPAKDDDAARTEAGAVPPPTPTSGQLNEEKVSTGVPEDERRPGDDIAAQRDIAEDAEPAPSAPYAAFDPKPLIEDLIHEVRGLGSVVAQLADEVERLRTISAIRASSTNAIERRLGRLEDILDAVFPDGQPGAHATGATRAEEEPRGEPLDDAGRATLVEVVQDAAEAYSDALVFLDASYQAARHSPYEDPDRVRAILEAMARVARRRRDGVLGTSLREAFSDLGIDYRAAIARNTPDRLREQYRFFRDNGDPVEAEEHIVLGNTYDPRQCLRIYFSSRVANEPRFVIGHVGRHFEVQSST